MKKHLTFLKGVSLAGLAVAALSGTCLTLTSCGGGGDNADTPEAKAAEYMENKSLELHMSQVCCYVTLNERLRGTGILDGTVQYGTSGTIVVGSLIVTKATMDGDAPHEMTVKISTNTSSISNETDFKTWWGVSGDNPLVLAGETYIVMKNFTINPGICTGEFTANTKTVTTDENGAETETEQELVGDYFKLEQ